MQKTIFITITRSFITRNILRCGVLDLLKKSNYKIFVFFSADMMPQHLKDEFESDQVKLAPIQVTPTRWYRLFSKLTSNYLIFTKSTKYRALYFNECAKTRLFSKEFLKKTKIVPWIRYIYLKILSQSKILKLLYRFIEFKFFPQENSKVKSYFDAHNPDIVFSTSSVSLLDNIFIKEAKRRNIATVAMPKSWDNIALGYMTFVPDYLLVPNNQSKDVAVHLQNIPASRVRVVGMPQFDWYIKKDIIKSREEYCKSKGLNPSLPLIFFGSEGVWAGRDYEVAEMIHKWITNNQLVKQSQLIVRPHYTNVYMDVFKNLRNKKSVAVDDYRIVDFLPDRWDPSKEEIIDFINTLYHCDITINIASTLSLDAACFDKPIINLYFGVAYEQESDKDITPELYDSDHFGWVLETGAVRKANSGKELKDNINRYLLDPSLEKKERDVLRNKLCYKIDGNSSKRIVDVLNNI